MAQSIRVTTKKRRGRPPTTGRGTQIGERWHPAELAAIDAWVASSADNTITRGARDTTPCGDRAEGEGKMTDHLSSAGPWTHEEDGLLRSMAAAGESVHAITKPVKRTADSVRWRAQHTQDQAGSGPAEAVGEGEMTFTGDRHGTIIMNRFASTQQAAK
jgi:hypothetical protein